MRYEKFDLPDWSLCYLINGDATGLSDEETAEIDAWMERAGVAWACPPEEEDGVPHYDPAPVFGLGAEVWPCYCAMKE